MKRAIATEPFVDAAAEGILVAGRAWMGPDLLWSHVCDGPRHILGALIARTLGHDGDAKVREQQLIVLPHEHVLRFDVAMDEALVVGILQGIGHLLT